MDVEYIRECAFVSYVRVQYGMADVSSRKERTEQPPRIYINLPNTDSCDET